MGDYPVLLIIWLTPLLGAVLCWSFGPQLKRNAGALGSAAIAASLLATLSAWNLASQQNGTQLGVQQHLFSWLPGFDFGLLLDPLSLIWVLIITGVGLLIHIYSIGYMWTDNAIARFFAYMNFFVFSMLTLVLSDNFTGLLVGWGLVGLASYFLIGFWFFKPSAVAAARKAFVINVVGDVGIMFAIFIIFAHVGSLRFGDVFAHPHALDPYLFLTCVFLFIGAAAKSAQLPLHTWLPDAMEGPTPVSALIHAATMVTAGVYLIARCAPLWSASHDAQVLAATVGCLTALAGASLGVAQWDIKRILAYSTMSQIGYMIMGVGVTAYSAGVAHFFTHAFFKACLFLGAGIVIHELSDEQDIRLMGGMRNRVPVAFWSMLAAVLAISGVPGFSGYFSKDQVIYGALEHGYTWMWAVGLITAGITAYYMFRLFFLTFFGTYRGTLPPDQLGITTGLAGSTAAIAHERHEPHGETHTHAPAWIMAVPVGILGFFSFAAGYMMMGPGSPWARFFANSFPHQALPPATISEGLTSVLAVLMLLIGFAIAYARYMTPRAIAQAPARLKHESQTLPRVLVRLYYFDDLIELLVVRPAQALGTFFTRWVEPHLIDGAVREVVFTNRFFGAVVASFQTGLLRAYALVIVFGAAIFAVYYAIAGGAH
ncbi:MAG TPA: NADH-quinone oxidoreductase subunit L [Candidatus Baltobacteraceae bacterium]|nr:NADH-quinone oxidoreductase subunit L [Candidatus Baltobacteraceae bacterium]